MKKDLNKVSSYKAECDKVLISRAKNSKSGYIFKAGKGYSEKSIYDFLIALKRKNKFFH